MTVAGQLAARLGDVLEGLRGISEGGSFYMATIDQKRDEADMFSRQKVISKNPNIIFSAKSDS